MAIQAKAITTIELQPGMLKYGDADWQPAFVGMGLLVAPIKLTSKDNSWGHAIELEGWSYAATDIFGRFLPKEQWYMAPVIVTLIDLIYRTGEDGSLNDLHRRELACDLLGVAGRVAVEIKFD